MLFKKKILFLGKIVLVTVAVLFATKDEGKNPKELHQYFLKNSPFKETKHQSKLDRFAQGLSPDRFYEEMYELTMDPSTGSPNYSSKQSIQNSVEESFQFRIGAVPGQDTATPWYTIGPNNQAGRTRAALFDLADGPDYDRVIAGGVSGGLWVNSDIDNAGQQWSRVTGVPGNLAVSIIIQDPTDTNVMYVGTGESYTTGDVTGNGIYKSTDGGNNWTPIFRNSSGQVTSTFNTGNNIYEVEGYFYINDLAIWDHDNNPATQEHLYAALGQSSHSKMNSTFLDLFDYGLFRSTDGGSTWTKLDIRNPDTNITEQFNDIDVQKVSNRLWLSTTSTYNNTPGGNFYFSEPDGANTITRKTPTWGTAPTNIRRTEIAPSATNTNTHYILASVNNEANLYKTTDDFVTIQSLAEPNDADTSISTTDFTRNQSFYDLEIEVDPTNDNIVYAGGINWHRSSDGGASWEQISKWSNNPNMNGLTVSEVHADQHGLYFRPNNSNQAVVVNDGGLAYCSSLSTASNTFVFNEMEGNFITTQFYRVAQTPPNFAGTDMVFGGTQDNGTYRLSNPQNNAVNGFTVTGGDGAATFFDQIGGNYMISNYVYNDAIYKVNYDGMGNVTSQGEISTAIPNNEGSFINPAALDSYNDVYFSNAGSGRVRVITDLDGTPATFLMTVGTSSDYVTALEVSRHTTDSTVLFVGMRSGEVKKITRAASNGSESISPIYNATGSVSDIHIGETEDEIYITYFNYGFNGNIVYSNDGTNFTSKEGDFPDIPVYSVLHNPFEEDEVIIGTELGVWRTSNFTNTSPGPNWVVAEEGMSDVAVHDMVYRGTSATDNRVVAGTFGRGIYVGSFTANSNAPVTNTDSITLAEGGTATTTTAGATSVLANDTDPEGDSLTADLMQNPYNSTVGGFTILSSTGSFTYTHDGSETTTDTFTYRAYDGTAYGDTVTVTINITPVNDCPEVANPISDFTAMEDDPDTIFNIEDLFSDAENDVLNVSISNANTALLTATLNTNTLTLDYIDNQTGVATITINVDDTTCFSTQSVFVVTVVPQNDAPVGSPDVINVFENGTATTTTGNNSSVLTDDTDTENDPLTATLVPGSGPFHHLGSFNLQSSGTFTYIHDGSETTTDTFNYTLSDGLSNMTVSVTINIIPVNDCPTTATPTLDFTVDEDDPDTIINLNNVFTDVDVLPMVDNLSYTVTHTNASLATVTINTATLTVDYAENQTGSLVVTVTADDGTCNTSNDAFTITVNAINDAPVGSPDVINVFENGTATTTTANNASLLTNDTDTENDALTATLVPGSGPFHHLGSFSLQSSGTFTYIHDGSETTTDTFDYTLTDGLSNVTVSVTINITPVNDCPTTATPTIDFTVDEDDPDTIINLNNVFTDVDVLPMVNNLSYTVTHTSASLATVTINTATLTIDYAENQTGSLVVTVTADDGTCNTSNDAFSITVNAINDVPSTVTDTISVDEGGTATRTTANNSSVLDNDSDIDGPNPINMQIVSNPQFGTFAWSGTGTFTYVHDGSETTTDSFSYQTFDGQDLGNIVVVDIIIMPVNDCPTNTIFRNDTVNEDSAGFGYPIASSDTSDPDNTYPLASYTVTYTNASLATITFDPSVGDPYFEPKLDQNGTMTGTVTINDGDPACTLEVPFQVTVLPINDCPTVDNNIADVSVNEDAADVWIDIQNIFSDVESSTLNYTVSSNDMSLVVPTLTATSIILDFQDNAFGNATLIITASDGDPNCTTDDLFGVTIASINDGPQTNPEIISVASGNTAVTLNDGVTSSVLANDSDPEGDPITAQLVTPPNNGSLILNSNGTFTYTHDGSATTTDTFFYRASDGFISGNTVSVTIYINTPPVAVTETIAVTEAGSATTLNDGSTTSLLANDTDADGDPLTAVLVTNPSEGTITLNANGTFVYVHGGGNLSSDSFTYSANDGKINSSPVTVSITVTGTNDPPVANNDNIIVALNGTATTLDNGQTSLIANDNDPDGDVLSATLVSSPSFGTLTLNPGGTFSYSQNGTLNSGDSFTYTVSDGTLTSASATVNILLSCSPCTESIIEAGPNGVSFSYTDCLCKTVRVYVPKGKAYTFCHLNNSINVNAGNYTLITSKVCN